MIPRYLVLRERVGAELMDIERAADKVARAYEAARQSGPQRAFRLDDALGPQDAGHQSSLRGSQ